MIDSNVMADRHEDLKKLATYLHLLDCHDPDCRWGCESWVFNQNNEVYNPSYCCGQSKSAKERFYDKAEKIYTYFGDNLNSAKRVVDFLTSVNAELAKNFIAAI